VVFAEGTTSNGESLLEFKKGAFVSEHAVIPVVLKYEWDMLSNAYDAIPFLPLFILHMSTFGFRAVIHELAPFVPNEHLFTKDGAKGKERWQVYSETVRDIMSKAGSMKLANQHFREKEEFQVRLGYKKARATTTSKHD